MARFQARQPKVGQKARELPGNARRSPMHAGRGRPVPHSAYGDFSLMWIASRVGDNPDRTAAQFGRSRRVLDRFGCIQDSRAFCQQFFHWYNEQHRHSGVGLLTPAMVHFGQTPVVLAQRQAVLDAAYATHPERFVRQPPKPLPLPSEVWINRPLPPGQKTEEGSQ